MQRGITELAPARDLTEFGQRYELDETIISTLKANGINLATLLKTPSLLSKLFASVGTQATLEGAIQYEQQIINYSEKWGRAWKKISTWEEFQERYGLERSYCNILEHHYGHTVDDFIRFADTKAFTPSSTTLIIIPHSDRSKLGDIWQAEQTLRGIAKSVAEVTVKSTATSSSSSSATIARAIPVTESKAPAKTAPTEEIKSPYSRQMDEYIATFKTKKTNQAIIDELNLSHVEKERKFGDHLETIGFEVPNIPVWSNKELHDLHTINNQTKEAPGIRVHPHTGRKINLKDLVPAIEIQAMIDSTIEKIIADIKAKKEAIASLPIVPGGPPRLA